MKTFFPIFVAKKGEKTLIIIVVVKQDDFSMFNGKNIFTPPLSRLKKAILLFFPRENSNFNLFSS